MRHLYFSFIINVLRRQRYEAPGLPRDHIVVTNVPLFRREFRCLKQGDSKEAGTEDGTHARAGRDGFVTCTYANGRDVDDVWEDTNLDTAVSMTELEYHSVPILDLYLWWAPIGPLGQ